MNLLRIPAGNCRLFLPTPIILPLEDQYHRLYQEEHDRIKKLLELKRGDFLKAHGVELTADRLDLMAKHCQDYILDIRDVCDIFIGHVRHIRECEKNISAKCGIHVTFSEEAIDGILEKHPLTREVIKSFCDRLGTAFEYGLGLLHQKKGVDQVVIPKTGIHMPEQYISDLVSNFFKT